MKAFLFWFTFQSCDLNSDGDEPFVGGANWSRVRLMANQLQAKLDESSAPCTTSSSSSSAASASAALAFRQQVRADYFLIISLKLRKQHNGAGGQKSFIIYTYVKI